MNDNVVKGGLKKPAVQIVGTACCGGREQSSCLVKLREGQGQVLHCPLKAAVQVGLGGW